MPKTTSRTTNKIAQQIYLKRAGVALGIYAKYADAGTVPTNLISGGGIKPLANQRQQPQPQAKPQKAQKAQQQATQPAAPAVEPIPANVPPPPYVPPPQSGLPPGQPMAPRKQAASELEASFGDKLDMSTVGGQSVDGFRKKMDSDAAAFRARANAEATKHVTPPPGAKYTATRRSIVNGQEVYNDTRSSEHPEWTPTVEYHKRYGSTTPGSNAATPPTTPAATPPATTPPAIPAAPATPPASNQPQPGTMTNDGQLSGVPATSPSLQPEPAPPAGQTHIENAANPAVPVPAPAQTHIAPDPNAHTGITTPAAVNPTGQAPGQTDGQSAGQTAGQTTSNTGNQAQNAGQPNGQPSGQPSGQPTGQPKPVDPVQFAQDLQKMPREQAIPKAKEYVQGELAKPENQQLMAGLDDLKSGDPARANSPAAQAYKAAMQKAPEGIIREEYERLMQANPTASPQEQGNFMRQAIDNGMARFNEMPFPAQLMMGLGLGAGLVGIFSSLFGDGGVETGLMGLLGIGAAGLIGANYGMFGNDARKMVGQGALGLGRMMGMKIPDAKAFTPEGIEQAKADATTSVMEALDGNAEKKIPAGGWQGGIKKIEELRSPLDQLANIAETYGRDFAITTLMGAMNTNDPSVAQQKFDMLMKQRQEMMDPQYLYNQAYAAALQKVPSWVPEAARPAAATGGLFATYGAYPGAKK